jgi:hypothetical protein
MKNEEPVSRRPQGCDYSDTIGQQEAAHREAIRRLDHIAGAPVDTATGRALDSWSSGGNLPGGPTPDLQGPEPPLGFGVVPVPTFEPRDIPQNTESIFRNVHRPGEKP